MKRCILWCAIAVPFLAPAARAQVKDTADLMPAQSLAYLEVRQPDKLSREVLALIKGSALENLPATLAKWRTEHAAVQPWYLSNVTGYGMLASPEVIQELGRMQGAAVAVTGFGKDFEPEFVAVVLSGDSLAPTFVMRVGLTMSEMRIVEKVEQVPLYRSFSARFEPGAPGQPGRSLPADWNGPTFALLPDAVVIGSTTANVKEVVQRYQGKTVTPALSSVAGFKDAGKLRERPGIFAYADCVALANLLDNAKEKPLSLSEYEWSILKTFINPKAARSVAASLTVNKGDIELRAQVQLDPKETSPLVQLLPDKPANLQLLHAAPTDSLAALTLDLADGNQRWQEIVKLADAVAKIGKTPEDFWPSKAIAASEKKLGLSFSKDVAAKIRGVAVVANFRGDVSEKGTRLPMLAIEGTSEAAAKDLETVLPKLLSLVNDGEEIAPSRETVQGYKISTLKGDNLPWRTSLHYGRQGTILVIGQNSLCVIDALQGVEKKGGLLGQQKVADALKDLDAPVAVGVWSLGETIVKAMKEIEHGASSGGPALPPKGAPPGPGTKPPAAGEGMDKYIKQVTAAVEPLPPAVLTLTRKPDSLTLEVRQPMLKKVSAKLIDILVEAALESTYRQHGGPDGGPGGIAPAPAP